MIILEKDNLSKYKISFLNDDFLYWPLPCVKRLKSQNNNTSCESSHERIDDLSRMSKA